MKEFIAFALVAGLSHYFSDYGSEHLFYGHVLPAILGLSIVAYLGFLAINESTPKSYKSRGNSGPYDSGAGGYGGGGSGDC